MKSFNAIIPANSATNKLGILGSYIKIESAVSPVRVKGYDINSNEVVDVVVSEGRGLFCPSFVALVFENETSAPLTVRFIAGNGQMFEGAEISGVIETAPNHSTTRLGTAFVGGQNQTGTATMHSGVQFHNPSDSGLDCIITAVTLNDGGGDLHVTTDLTFLVDSAVEMARRYGINKLVGQPLSVAYTSGLRWPNQPSPTEKIKINTGGIAVELAFVRPFIVPPGGVITVTNGTKDKGTGVIVDFYTEPV